ncbi:MAG: adenylate/guanylate cyclase domain-containing protein [Solirubrobacterales bacterium]
MPAQTETETRYARVGDASVAFQVTGDGPPDVLFLPGFVSNVEQYWLTPGIPEILHRFERYSRLIRFDKRGTGLSDPMRDVPTIDDRLDDTLAVMDAAGSERAHLFGVSEGGPLSILFAATYPERVASLVLYGAAARYTQDTDYPMGWPEGMWESEELTAFMLDGWADGSGLEVFAPSHFGDPEWERAWGQFKRAGGSPAMGLQTMQALSEIDVREILPSIQAPTLLLHREGDRAMQIACSEFMAERIPNCRMIKLEGQDHLWFSGDVDSIFDPIEEFITGGIAPPVSDRVLATVLFTDIVGSTDRAAELGDERWRELLTRHDEAMRELVERHRGRTIKSTGDGILAIFDGPTRALACATAAEEAVQPLGIALRAGLHTGECELVGDDIAGLAVHIAARVAARAAGGEVLVSRTVKDLVVGSGVEFQSHGATELKGIPGEWQLFAVAATA